MVSCYARRFVVFLLLVITPTCAPVQRAEKQAAPSLIALRAARLLDVRSGRLISNAVVLVEGERIKAAGERLAVTSGAQVIDLGDVKHVHGLMVTHTTITHVVIDA